MHALPNLSGKRILYADDEADGREIISLGLGTCGVQVTQTSDGQTALDLYASGKFDVVLTDYSMPGLKGDELARQIKALHPTQRVVMLTGFGDNLLQGGQCPPYLDALINKPCSLNALIAALFPA